MNPEEIFHRLQKAGDEFADLNAAADLLEETKYTMLSQCAADYPNESNASAEAKARRDPRFIEHLTAMVHARKLANKAKVKVTSIQTWVDLMRSKQATDRAMITKGL